MKRWILLKIPVRGSNEFVGFTDTKKGLELLYPIIGNGCDCVERVKVDTLPYHPYLWVDENGLMSNQPANLQASALAGQRILGTALLDMGKWDFYKPGEFHRWEKRIASYPRTLRGVPFLPEKLEVTP